MSRAHRRKTEDDPGAEVRFSQHTAHWLFMGFVVVVTAETPSASLLKTCVFLCLKDEMRGNESVAEADRRRPPLPVLRPPPRLHGLRAVTRPAVGAAPVAAVRSQMLLVYSHTKQEPILSQK